MQGWITLHRKIEENELWLSEPFSRGQAWVDLLLIANHKPQLLYKRNIPITIERGQVGWSQEKLAKRWKWGRKKVATFLKTLENAQQIVLNNNHTLSHIIIVNYDKYQQKEQQSHNSRTTDRTNNNNVNNENNNSEKISDELKANQNETMLGWNNKSDDYDEGVVDYDSGELTKPEEEQKLADKELNAKIKHNLSLLEEMRGLPFGKGRDLNYHIKIYREMLKNGWTHNTLIDTLIEVINSDHWKEQKKMGQYPGMNTIQFHLRNKKPS